MNSLQILKHGDWKVLTYYDLEDFLFELEEQGSKEEEKAEEASRSSFEWLSWVIPISPPCLRPTHTTAERGTSYNDITHRLSAIVRTELALRQAGDSGVERRRCAVRLQLALTLFFFLPTGARESRELSSISDRFKGKQGRLRQSLLGKRLCFSARTVITGDPCLRLTELGVPVEVAEKLTKPVRVAAYNYEYLQELLRTKQIKYVLRGNLRFDPVYRKISLKVSDICHVKLQDGMRVLFNRQPTLWRSSVQCLYVRRVRRKTFSINAEITPAFNADFDGDEMNMYVPQDLECEGELECLMQSREHLLTGGQGLVQDTALGAYLLSLEGCRLTRVCFFKCLNFILHELSADERLQQHFDMRLVCAGPEFKGRALLSCLMGDKVQVEAFVEQGHVVGDLNKATLKKKILPQVVEHYGAGEAANFLFLLGRISAEFLRRRGFSVGVSSLEPWKTVDEKVALSKEVKEFVKTTQSKDEWLLLRLGNLYKSVKAVRTKGIFSEDNALLTLGNERSGAKGSLLNLIQIRSALGQQYYKGSLIRKFRGNRSLSSEPLRSVEGQTTMGMLERRGFIESNFLKGLSPTELMLHAMTSRLSLLDTALKTSETGYASRRLGKSLEDCIVQYDNTLRNGDRVLLFDVDHFKCPEIQAGYGLGIIAAQSIGQRVMQLTLNTFHTAGTACLEVSDGVPRMEALINVWTKKLAENSLLSVGGTSAWQGHQWVRKYDCLQLKDLFFKQAKVVRIKNAPPSCSPYGLKLFLDEIVCKKNRVCAWDLERAIRQSEGFRQLLPVARPKCLTCFFQTNKGDAEAKRELREDFLPRLRSLYLRGAEHKVRVSWSPQAKALQLKGMLLRDCFELFTGKWARTSSSNILEVQEVLGIEAARATLLNELNKVFNDGVRVVYLFTLAEWMCWLGKLCPVTRNGIMRSNDNAWKNMAFEQCLKTAARNADQRCVCGFDGTSERIIVNDYVRQGTGICATRPDRTMELQAVLERAAEPLPPQYQLGGEDDEMDIYGGLEQMSLPPAFSQMQQLEQQGLWVG